MTGKQAILTFLFEETRKPKNGKGIIFLDIDDTLLTAQGIYIKRKLPTDEKVVKLTPAEYAHEKVTAETKQYYDYSDFRNAEKVGKSITTGLPIIPNLKLMDAYVNAGWKIGVLTARGMEPIIDKSLRVFLKIRDNKGDLKEVGDKLARELVHAVNDANKKYPGLTDFEKKANVLRDYANQGYQIKFLDDDDKNIKAVREMAKKEKLDITAIKAH